VGVKSYRARFCLKGRKYMQDITKPFK
jgi:hypothetical protein